MHRAIFLDRDGVIIENVDSYVRSWSDVVVLPGALDALVRLRNSDYKIIVVTNQSAVGRGIISIADAQVLNERLVALIAAAGGRIDDVFLCPHAPSDLCACRKPQPGLLLQAAGKHALDLENCLLVGDALTDIQAGFNAGVGHNILVRTGRGEAQLARPEASRLAPFSVFDTLAHVVDYYFPDLPSQT